VTRDLVKTKARVVSLSATRGPGLQPA